MSEKLRLFRDWFLATFDDQVASRNLGAVARSAGRPGASARPHDLISPAPGSRAMVACLTETPRAYSTPPRVIG